MKVITRLAAAAFTQVRPLPSYETRKPEFALISRRPFMALDGRLDLNKSFHYNSYIEPADKIVGDTAYLKTQISCADDIVYHASKLGYNIEVIAHGIQFSLPEALLEAARIPEAEDCKYIVLKTFKKQPAVILENIAAPESNKALVIRMSEPVEPRIAHLS